MLEKIFRRHSYRRIFPYKKLEDEFYEMLNVSCNGAPLFIPENLYCVDYAIRNLPTDDPVIEIGSFLGMSTNILLSFIERHDRKNILFNCDKWEFEEHEKNFYARVANKSSQEIKQYIRESYIRNLKFFSGDRLPFTIELFSDEFFELWKIKEMVIDVFGREMQLGGPITFAYLDGNHQYEFVKRDFENSNEFLVKGGFVFFDDSADHINCGTRDFVKEMKRRSDYELVIKNPNYLFRKIL